MRFVIDLAAIAHRIRCWWWELTRQEADEGQCVGCGVHLTQQEQRYYLWNCERCEGDAMAKWGGV